MVDDHTYRLTLKVDKAEHTHRRQHDSRQRCFPDTLQQLRTRDSASLKYGMSIEGIAGAAAISGGKGSASGAFG